MVTTWDNPRDPLLSVALELSATRSLDRLLPVVVQHLVGLLGVERALFALFDDDGRIEDATVHGLVWERGTPLPISHRVVAEVRETRELRRLFVPDPTDAAVGESLRRHQLRFVLAAPVFENGRVAGVLYGDSRLAVGDQDGDRAVVLRALANLVGMAVENVHLHEEQRIRTLMLGKLVHDLSNPMMVVKLDARVLGDSLEQPALLPVVDDLVFASDKMEAYCRSALRLVGVGAPAESPSEVAPGEILTQHAHFFQRIAEQYEVRLHAVVPSELPTLRTHADRLGLTLDNLVFNAIKHARSGSVVVLGARLRRDAGPPERDGFGSAIARLFRTVSRLKADPDVGFVELSVHNEGRAIDPDLAPHVFEAWVRGDAPPGAPVPGLGLGLGLAIVDQCVRSLGGRVWVESEAGRGTTFRFTLPVATA